MRISGTSRICGLALTVGCAAPVVGLPSAAGAQMMEPITMVGYFERSATDHPDITVEIVLSSDGRTRRPFGLMRVQSQIGTSGSDVFKRSLKPVILLRGPQEMIAKLDAAAPVQKVKIIGMFDLRTTGIIVNGVDVAPLPPISGRGEADDAAPGKE